MKWSRALLVRLLRVPPEPQPPDGSADSLMAFRAAPAYYRYSLLKWAIPQFGALAGLLFSIWGFELLTFDGLDRFLERYSLGFLELVGIPIFALQAVVGFLLLRMHYELRWYMVSDRSLRIREGIYVVKERTMTIANIQNMAVHQGPLQKWFGIADLQVRTAGGAGGDESSNKKDDPHLGILRGLHNAKEIRDLIWKSLRLQRDSGLGDPDDETRSSTLSDAGDQTGQGAAALAVLREARGLRLELETAVAGRGL